MLKRQTQFHAHQCVQWKCLVGLHVNFLLIGVPQSQYGRNSYCIGYSDEELPQNTGIE